MKRPHIGMMRERITIQQESQTPDGAGGYALAWTAYATNIYARVVPGDGGERLEAMRLESSVPYRVTIRHQAGITSAMRILWGSVVLNIRAISNPDERNEFMELLCDQGEAT